MSKEKEKKFVVKALSNEENSSTKIVTIGSFNFEFAAIRCAEKMERFDHITVAWVEYPEDFPVDQKLQLAASI